MSPLLACCCNDKENGKSRRRSIVWDALKQSVVWKGTIIINKGVFEVERTRIMFW